MEGERGDEDRDGEADPRHRAGARDGRPSHRRPQLAARQLRHEQRAADDAAGLAEEIAEEDPERDRRRVRVREEVAVDRDPRIGESEQRHDHVARPRVVELLQALVRRDRSGKPQPGLACQLGCRLLPEAPEQVARALEIAARGGIRERQEPRDQSDDDRVDAGLEQRDPHRRGEREIQQAVVLEAEVDAHGAHGEDHAEDSDRDQQRTPVDVRAVDDRDHREREDVVDDRDGEQERAQPVRGSASRRARAARARTPCPSTSPCPSRAPRASPH